MDLQEKINLIQKELDNTTINRQRQRYLESYLFELITYAQKHPEVIEEPTPLTLYCDMNPDARECKIFDV